MRSRSERCARREEQREAAVPDGAPTEAPLAARGARKRARAACGPQAPLEALHEALREDFECSICYELLCRPTALRCGHTFCRPCLVRQRKAECAVCRAKVPAELPAVNVVLQGALQRHLAGEYAAREAVLPAGDSVLVHFNKHGVSEIPSEDVPALKYASLVKVTHKQARAAPRRNRQN